ncbi:retrovirus-related pol polyprotein from transposon TNT 1-94 [Tanacetum coccineum]
MTHPSPKRNMAPKAVLMRSGLVSLTTARPVNTAQPKSTVNSARPMTNVFNKAHSTGNPQQELQEKGVIDSGCSRHMTGNMSYLSNSKRKNRTLIEAARTMLADSKLPTTFWAKAVNTACYVQNRVLVTKPHNKTPYELFLGRKPTLGFMKPFGYLVIILNTIDHLGKFDGKADEGFFVGYSINSKAFIVFNSRTRIVEENLHVQFRNQFNSNAGIKACDDAGKARMETFKEFSELDSNFRDDGKKVIRNQEKHSEVTAVGAKQAIELPE